MAEIKNSFLGSKMNQDIDDRLMPNNEYRYALNLEINRSENSDVGTLQNILGNSLTVDFNALADTTGLEAIGVLADDSNNNIYVALTDNSGSSYSPTAKNYIYVYNNKNNTSTLLTSGSFLNFSMSNPVVMTLIENLLFITDNRNQPRKINVQKASTNTGYYTNEAQISVAKISPLYSPVLFKESDFAVDEYETTMYDVVSVKLPNGTTDNPYHIDNWPGDPNFLESKYVRFSYRYKFEDSEYSIMAPFTQIAFIPKQDGYFLYKPPLVVGGEPVQDDETSAYRSTVVDFMSNKVNNILLQIILPCPANELYSKYKITEIEILYKEADDLAVSAVDSIPTIPDPSKDPYFWNTTEEVYSYDYQSKKPFKTLPSRDVIRVSDIVPVRAQSQEIVGNRVVYGNYQDKFSYPKYLDYNVGASEKLPFGLDAEHGTSRIEYPNHSVKENRNYQVGVVLCDKFGRESGVILSDKTSSFYPGVFGSSSLYIPYSGVGDIIPSNWAGNSLKILFNNPISPSAPNSSTGWPGLYNDDVNSVDYNPLGWYSYKIVVKQTEQDYYNVYLPGVMASYPEDTSTLTEEGKTSHVVLINDNINKVPRDLSEVGPSQKQFRSSVIMYPRVNNNTEAFNNEQYDTLNEYVVVSTIATNNSLFFSDNMPTILPTGFENFYQIDSDPLIARMSTMKELGVASNTSDVINLSIYETKPVESRLDIYWETSTSGIISELNIAIQEGSTSSVDSMVGWNFSLTEASSPGDIATSPFLFQDILGDEIMPTSVVIESATDGNNSSVLSKFIIENIPSTNTYRLITAPGAYFYYGFNGAVIQSYKFSIKATVGSPPVSKSFNVTGNLVNIQPTINEDPIVIEKATGDIDVFQFTGDNGSNPAGGNSTSDLTWNVSGSPAFSITSDGLLQNLDGDAEGNYDLVITLTEASGNVATIYVQVQYPVIQNVIWSNVYQFVTTGESYNYTYGTVEIIGSSVEFKARASIIAGTGTILTSFNIDGINRNVSRDGGYDGIGTSYSSALILPPGIYSYELTVSADANVFYGEGAISYTQL